MRYESVIFSLFTGEMAGVTQKKDAGQWWIVYCIDSTDENLEQEND